MGVGDAVWPAPEPCACPTLLDFPAPNLLVYPREAVVAEKFEAMPLKIEREIFDFHGILAP